MGLEGWRGSDYVVKLGRDSLVPYGAQHQDLYPRCVACARQNDQIFVRDALTSYNTTPTKQSLHLTLTILLQPISLLRLFYSFNPAIHSKFAHHENYPAMLIHNLFQR